MRRVIAILSGLAFAASLAGFTVANAQDTGDKPAKHNKMMMHSSKKHMCPPGKHWVQGYTTKKGVKVKGYCR
ncbi:MAG: hypothetical protein JO083_11600 [Candidatus Eremiobacteraeota bacterium]|nr:hypothetical protein [Candidatus Eremiobacteraeota bacterium]MBV8368452.1 hypothetical protein [Candidatus Eremiobacteraeota bacterium]